METELETKKKLVSFGSENGLMKNLTVEFCLIHQSWSDISSIPIDRSNRDNIDSSLSVTRTQNRLAQPLLKRLGFLGSHRALYTPDDASSSRRDKTYVPLFSERSLHFSETTLLGYVWTVRKGDMSQRILAYCVASFGSPATCNHTSPGGRPNENHKRDHQNPYSKSSRVGQEHAPRTRIPYH
jgi:hypothetical protein